MTGLNYIWILLKRHIQTRFFTVQVEVEVQYADLNSNNSYTQSTHALTLPRIFFLHFSDQWLWRYNELSAKMSNMPFQGHLQGRKSM